MTGSFGIVIEGFGIARFEIERFEIENFSGERCGAWCLACSLSTSPILQDAHEFEKPGKWNIIYSDLE
jgi:hypothetical protein